MKDLFIEDFFDQQTISFGKENLFGKLELGIGERVVPLVNC